MHVVYVVQTMSRIYITMYTVQIYGCESFEDFLATGIWDVKITTT